jgi:hypothetical protein
MPAGEGIPDEAEPTEPTCILLSSTELYRPWPLAGRTMRGEYDMIDSVVMTKFSGPRRPGRWTSTSTTKKKAHKTDIKKHVRGVRECRVWCRGAACNGSSGWCRHASPRRLFQGRRGAEGQNWGTLVLSGDPCTVRLFLHCASVLNRQQSWRSSMTRVLLSVRIRVLQQVPVSGVMLWIIYMYIIFWYGVHNFDAVPPSRIIYCQSRRSET